MKTVALIIFLLPNLSFAQPRELEVEPNHSTVGFGIDISGFTIVTGKFTDYDLFMDWDDSTASVSTLSATIRASSINTGIPGRDEHLQSADFFDVEKYPEIVFQSDSIQKVNYAHFNAFGKLKMHGVTKSIILPLELVKVDGNTVGVRSRTTINRSDYGVGTGFNHTSMPDFLSDEIKIEIDFWTKKKKKTETN